MWCVLISSEGFFLLIVMYQVPSAVSVMRMYIKAYQVCVMSPAAISKGVKWILALWKMWDMQGIFSQKLLTQKTLLIAALTWIQQFSFLLKAALAKRRRTDSVLSYRFAYLLLHCENQHVYVWDVATRTTVSFSHSKTSNQIICEGARVGRCIV